MGYTKTSEAANLNRYQAVDDDASVLWLEKAQSGKVSLEDIQDALAEFSKLFKAGMASKAETLTLARAFPDSPTYTEAARKQSEKDDTDPIVIGGPASVSLVDREGHLITTQALERAFQKFMSNDRTRNVMVLHSDVQIGWALPAYISKGGQIFKSGVDDKGLFFICELRDDTSIAKKVADQIHKGMLKSYSIAGSATKIQNMTKGLVPYVQVDDMELAEVTVCEKGVNQGASFEILKAEQSPHQSFGAKLIRKPEPKPTPRWSEGDDPPNWERHAQTPLKDKMIMRSNDDGTINFNKSFTEWLIKESDPLKTKEAFATLNNEAGRQAEHAQLLREYGFPSAQPVESMRYVPVVETETDDDGIPIHNLPPWVVNEAGEALGDRLDEDSPGYKKSDKAKARQKAGSAQKMFMDFMEKDMPTNKPLRYPSKPYGRPAGTPAPVKANPKPSKRDKQETQINPKKDIEKQGREGLEPGRERGVQEMSDREAAARREAAASERDTGIAERASGRSAADAAHTTGGEATERVGTSRPAEPPSSPADFSRGRPTVQRPERSEARKQEIQRQAFQRKVGRGAKGAFAGGRESREQLGETLSGAGRAVGSGLGAAGRGIGRLFGAGKERAAAAGSAAGRGAAAAGRGAAGGIAGGVRGAAGAGRSAAGGIAGGVKGFGREVKRGYRGPVPDTATGEERQRGFGSALGGDVPEGRKQTMASRMGRLFRSGQERTGAAAGAGARQARRGGAAAVRGGQAAGRMGMRGGAAAGRMGMRGGAAAGRMGRTGGAAAGRFGQRAGKVGLREGIRGGRAGLRGAREALGGAAEGYGSYDPSTKRFRDMTTPGQQGDYAFADKKPSMARRIGRMFGQTGRGTQEAVGAGVGAGARFGAGTAAGLAGTSGARGGGDPEDVGGKGRVGGAGYRLGRVGREFARGAMRGGTPSERLRAGRDESRFGEGARGGRESTAERMGRYFGRGSRGVGSGAATAGRVGGRETAKFIGEHAPRVGAGSRRGRAERAAGAASLDAEHSRIGIGGDRTLNHYAHHGKSYAESNNLVSDIRQNQGPKTIGDHLAAYQHMLSNHHGDHQGDKIVHTSLNLPEGMTHNSVIDNHAFVSMMHPEGGHADYAPTSDYQNNHQGVMDNVHKVLGQYAGGKIPPKMDTGAGQRTIQSEASAAPAAAAAAFPGTSIPTGEGRTPGIPAQSVRQEMGIGHVPPQPTSTTFQPVPPTGTTPLTGPSRRKNIGTGNEDLSEITASIDKMLNKALRAKSRGYSKGWGVKHHVNR
jgi:HK97 family phage prohead protease